MLNQVQAIHPRTYIETLTFTGIPSKDTRETLSRYGFQYKNGNWYKSETTGDVTDEAGVAKAIAA